MQTRSAKLRNEGLLNLIQASTSVAGTLPPSSSLPNNIVDAKITLADVSVSGIENVQPDWLEQCVREGSVLKLVATAERIDTKWRFHVEPPPMPIASFLGSCSGWEMAIEILSDIYGKSFHKLWEREPVPTAASMLRDAVHLATMGRQGSL